MQARKSTQLDTIIAANIRLQRERAGGEALEVFDTKSQCYGPARWGSPGRAADSGTERGTDGPPCIRYEQASF